MADIAELIVALRLQDGVSSGLGNLNRQLSGMSGGLSQVNRGIGQVAGGLDRALTRGAIAAATGLGAVVTAAVSFEDAFAGVRKTVDETATTSFEDLNESLREMARTIPISFQELAGIAEAGGALGIGIDALDEFTRVVADLANTTDLSADQAATSLGVLGNVLGLTADEFDNFGSALVDLGNKGASTESAILEIAERVGATGELVGLSTEQVLGFSAAVANLGIESEAGGSAIQRFLIDSLTAVEQGGEGLETFARTAGVSAEAFQTAFRDDAGAALADFIEGLSKLPEAVQIQTLQDLGFNDVRITRTLLGLAGDVDGLNSSLTISAEAFAENSALSEEASKRYATTASQLKILKQNVTDAAVVIGDELLPIVSELTTEFVKFINTPEVRDGIKTFAVDLAQGIRDFAEEVRRGDFNQLIDVLKGAAGIAKAGFDAFRALPPGIQSLALAAFGINKLTGGALTGIASGLGNIISGGIKILFERGASPANPLWVQSVGGPLGGGAGGGGLTPGGAAVTIIGGLSAAAIADFLEEPSEALAQEIHDQLQLPDLPGPGDWQWPFGSKNPPRWLPDFLGGPNPISLFKESADLWKPEFHPEFSRYLAQLPTPIGTPGGMRNPGEFAQRIVLPDTAMAPLVDAISDLRDVLDTGGKTIGQAIDRFEDGSSRVSGKAPGFNPEPPGNFVPEVKLDPSQVTDLREATDRATTTLRELYGMAYGADQANRTANAFITAELSRNRAATVERLTSLASKYDTQAGQLSGINSRLDGANSRLERVANKNFSPTINALITNNLSVNEWQRTVYSSVRATTPTSPTFL